MAKHDRAYWKAREETLQRDCSRAEDEGDWDKNAKLYKELDEHYDDKRRWGVG